MKLTRRALLRLAAAAGLGAALPSPAGARPLTVSGLPRFCAAQGMVNELRSHSVHVVCSDTGVFEATSPEWRWLPLSDKPGHG